MTHAWLFTGPPGSGRSVAARAFAAALQCPDGGDGTCHACRTVLAGTHADVQVDRPRRAVDRRPRRPGSSSRVAGRAPSQGRWQVILVEDADRMTEQAANAVLKMIEEPPPRTVFMLCAPSLHPDDVPVTIRSRCRVVALRTPPVDAIADVLIRRDGVDPALAAWSAGGLGRSRGPGPAAGPRRGGPAGPQGGARRPAVAGVAGGLPRRRRRPGRGGQGGDRRRRPPPSTAPRPRR